MKLYSKSNDYVLYEGSMLDLLDNIPECSIHAVITDPPYELNFMNKGWDSSGIAFQKETWEKCLKVLKPGGYLLAFGGSRTFHRIACAIEDAGFEIRDTIMWLYGSGFPKSMNIGLAIDKKEGLQEQRGIGGFNVGGIQEQNNRKAKLYIGSTTDGSKQKAYTDYKSDMAKLWAGWGTALKPAYEPIIVARKPCEGSCTDNVIQFGVGGINIDECRIGDEIITTSGARKNPMVGDNRTGKALGMFQKTEALNTEHSGRHPANVILTYNDTDYDEVCGGMPETKGKNGFKDKGSASRYFYCAKASKRDRDEGLDELPNKSIAFSNQAQAELKRGVELQNGGLNKILVRKNIHPTVKPTELMQYLVRLVTPKGGVILDPFNGSGSTGKAVMFENKDRQANYKYIGIELTPEYLPISEARIKWAKNGNKTSSKNQVSVFDLLNEESEVDE